MAYVDCMPRQRTKEPLGTDTIVPECLLSSSWFSSTFPRNEVIWHCNAYLSGGQAPDRPGGPDTVPQEHPRRRHRANFQLSQVSNVIGANFT